MRAYLLHVFNYFLITTISQFADIKFCFTDEYVICNGCKSPDTILSKENRLFFLRCEKVFFNTSPTFFDTHTTVDACDE